MITYPTGAATSFTYTAVNPDSPPASMTDASGATTWDYNDFGEVLDLVTPQGTVNYGYDTFGRRISMAQTGAGTTTYKYYPTNQLQWIVNPLGEKTTWDYDSIGRTWHQTLANGIVTTYGFDNRNRVTGISHATAGGTTIHTEGYTLDPAGNLTQRLSDGLATTYGYDNADQLLSEFTTGKYIEHFSYDGNGNRLGRAINGVTENYSYDAGDKLQAVTVGGAVTKSYTYDLDGRTTSITTPTTLQSFTYDYEDRITSVTYSNAASSFFTYNALDARVGKVDGTGSFSYLRDGANSADPVLIDGLATYTFGISQKTTLSNSIFDLHDYIGTSTHQTSNGGAVTATRNYDAYGNLIASTNNPVGPFGHAGAIGYEEDSQTGLKLLGHRYYDATIGRFLTRDPAQNGPNWYAYGDNDPASLVDPDGLQARKGGNRTYFKSSRGQAEEEARNFGEGKPIHHSNPNDGSDPHFHPVDRYGKKIEGPHYSYPRKNSRPGSQKSPNTRGISDEHLGNAALNAADLLDALNPRKGNDTPLLDWFTSNVVPILPRLYGPIQFTFSHR